jgi:tRNA(adenine34) deaminase
MTEKDRHICPNDFNGAEHISCERDRQFMQLALEQARIASAVGEVPVGAAAVAAGRIVGTGCNRKETTGDPTAHAEMVALREAAAELGRWRLSDVTLYVTLEPCVMCAGAMVQSRLARLVFGTPDPKGGACGSEYHILQDFRLNHRVNVTGGVLQEEAASLLREFFATRRAPGIGPSRGLGRAGILPETGPETITGAAVSGQER